MEYGRGHAGTECTEGPGPVPVKGQFTALTAFMMDAQKDLRMDMGENFPCLGHCDRTKASAVLPGGDALLLYRK